jgi:hypothetical protein
VFGSAEEAAVALFMDGMGCPLCGRPMTHRQDLIGFTAVFSGDPVVRRLDDGVCHRDCLGHWEYRDAFVRGWNREAMYSLGPFWFLEVTRSGEVRYLSRLGRMLYRWGWKRSPLLPELIHRSRPLLLFRATHRGYSPLWLHKRYGCLHDNPQPEAIGLPPESAAEVRAWAERYDELCDRSGGEDRPAAEEWEQFQAEGRRLWEVLKQGLGRRYRVVYLEVGRIFEPEARAE